jgi:hypothetical protein
LLPFSFERRAFFALVGFCKTDPGFGAACDYAKCSLFEGVPPGLSLEKILNKVF